MKSTSMIAALMGLSGSFAQVSPAAAPSAPPAPPAPSAATITKVVGLLKSMQSDLQQEAAADKDAYSKIQCWCTDNIKDKTRELADQKARIAQQQSTAAGSKAASSRLKEEIAQLQADLAKSQESLNSASTLREKQGNDFREEEQELVNSIKALAGAVSAIRAGVARGVNGTSFLATAKANPFTEVSKTLERFSSMLEGTITPSQKRIIVALSQGALRGSYTPESGEILGILQQMKDTFEENLKKLRATEDGNGKSFVDLQTAKTSEVSATQTGIQQKQVQLAQAVAAEAQANQDIADTGKAEGVDTHFLADLEAKCAAFTAEFNNRQNLRNTEAVALGQALVLLSSGAAQETLSRTFQPASFVQIHEAVHQAPSSALADAAQLLDLVASKTTDSRVAVVAKSARLDGVEQVRQAIDKLIQQLVAETAAEKEQRESCLKRSGDNKLATEQFARDAADATSRVTAAQIKVQDLAGSAAALSQEIVDLKAQLVKLANDRALETKDFQQTLKDQKSAQGLLQDAIDVLSKVYSKQVVTANQAVVGSGSSFLQAPNTTGPAGFGAYGAGRANGGNVVAILQQLLADAKALEQKATAGEASAKVTFQKVTSDTNAAIAAKQATIVDLNAGKADAQQQLISAQQDLSASKTQLTALSSTGTGLKTECVSLLTEFDTRQAARRQEIAALSQAKGILAAPAQAVLPSAA